MAGIQLSGLASGFDWKSTVTQLMTIERVPQDNLRKQQAAAAKVQAAFDTLKTNLTALKTAASALSTSFTGSARSVSVSSGDGVTSASDATVSTSSGAALGTYKINVLGLPKASSGTGSDTIYPELATAKAFTLGDYGVTEGTVTVGDTQYTISAADLGKTVDQIFGGGVLTLTPTGGSAGTVGGVTTAFGAKNALELTGASISMGGPGDTSNFLSALGLSYDGTKYVQVIPQSVLAKVTLDKLGAGMAFPSDTLTINGVSVGTISSTSTLGAVVAQINSASGTGVTAIIDPSTGKLRLTANANGDYPITVTDGNGGAGVAQVLGLDTIAASLSRGSGTTFTLAVDGGAPVSYTSPTAEIDLSRYGYGSTKISPSSTGVFSVKVTSNSSDNRTKINALISAYNSLKQMVDDSTKVTKGADGTVTASVFSNRSDINTLLSGVRSRIYTEVAGTGISSQYNTMGKIGIGFDKTGTMSVVDSAKLDAALASNPTAVGALFNSGTTSTTATVSTQGVASRIISLMTALTGTGGLVETATAALTTQTKRFQSQISALDRSLAQRQATLEASFIAMERAQSKFNNMSAQISSAFSSNK